MAHIKIKKGLNIPIKGKPEGPVQNIIPGGEASPLKTPSFVSLNLSSFDDVKFHLVVSQGDGVKKGQPLAEDKSCPGRMFTSPASGRVHEIRRGLKRVLTDIIIQVGPQEESILFPPMDAAHSSREEIIDRLKMAGLFAAIRVRPFNLLANPALQPQSIFVKAIESAPFKPPAELQVQGYEHEFQQGLNILAKLVAPGCLHLVYHKDTPSLAFKEAKNVEKHTAEGPHPIGNVSVHIEKIDRILAPSDIKWTLSTHDVISIGFLFLHHHILTDRVISIAGPGILPNRTGYFKASIGYPVDALISGRLIHEESRLISGDPLTGRAVTVKDFLGYRDDVFCIIPENNAREFLHFLRVGANKFTYSWAYMSGHKDNTDREYDFTTSLHGEHRAFIDGSVYEDVMPLDVPVMLLAKAVLAEDFELAEQYGLLEVDSEDFALPAFICPSKIELIEIIKKGLKQYSKEILQ